MENVTDVKCLVLNGVEYVRKEDVGNVPATKVDGMDYCIIRTYSAGVFAGYLESREGKEAKIRKVRRIWYWDGATSLSQLAIDGVSKPENCKFAEEVDEIIVTEAIEIIKCTVNARKNIQGVYVWKK